MRPKRSASASVFSCRSRFAAWLAVPIAVGLACSIAGAAEAPKKDAGAPPPKIGVVDIDKILEALQSWQDTESRLRREQAEAEKELAEQKKEVDRIQAELAYFKPGSGDYEQRRAQLVERQQELARRGDLVHRRLADRSQAVLEAARNEVREAVREYAAANGFDVVVDAQAVLYVTGGADISLEVAREMNKRYKELRQTEKPQSDEGNK